MGSVFAKSVNSGGVMPNFVPLPDAYAFNSATNHAQEQTIQNPGTMDELHKKCKDVMPVTFEGVRVMVNKALSTHFHCSHTANMSASQPGGYRFGATYIGAKSVSASESFPVLLGEIDPMGNLSSNIIHQLTPRIRCKFASQIQNGKVIAAQLSSDYKADDSTFSLTVGNPNLVRGSGIIVSHYLQSVTNKLDLGAELAYQYGLQVPGGEIAMVSAAARYSTKERVMSGTLGLCGLHLCYHQKSNEQIQFGIELESDFRTHEAVCSISMQIDAPKANFIYKGIADSNWNVGGVLEKRLQPIPVSFILSVLMHHRKNQIQLGCGLIFG